MRVKSRFAGRQWWSIWTRGRGWGSSGWKKCPVNTWLAAVPSNRSQRASASRWHSVKRQRGHQRWALGDMDGQFGRGRSCTDSKHREAESFLEWSLYVVYEYLQSISRSKSLFYFALYEMGFDVLPQPSSEPSVSQSCNMCKFFAFLSRLFCLKGASLVRCFWWRLSGVSGLSRAGIPVEPCSFICESSAPQWTIYLQAWTSDVTVVRMRTEHISAVLTIPSGESPHSVIQL